MFFFKIQFLVFAGQILAHVESGRLGDKAHRQAMGSWMGGGAVSRLESLPAHCARVYENHPQHELPELHELHELP